MVLGVLVQLARLLKKRAFKNIIGMAKLSDMMDHIPQSSS